MIRSLSFSANVISKRKLISQISVPKSYNLVKHVARISGTCINSSGATPSSAHGPQTKFTLDIKLPDLARDPELPGPEIPSHFQPSSHAGGVSSIRNDVDHEAPMRPIFVVAGASSQQSAGGPTYEEHSQASLEHSAAPPIPAPSLRTGLWADCLDALGIPPHVSFVNPLKQSGNLSPEQPPRGRPLDDEEKRGLRALFLIIGGIWLAGSLGKPKPKKHAYI